MLIPIFPAEIKSGQITFQNKGRFLQYLKSLSGAVEVIVRPHKKHRTHSQNNLYWLYLALIASETGDNAADLHDYFKRRYLPPKFINACGHTIKIPGSTTDLSVNQFGEYLDRIEQECGVPIPDWNLVVFT